MAMITNLASFFFHQIQEAERENDRIYEPVIGIVTDNKDPDKLMRVKVKLPTISADDSTWWVPIVSLGAGADRGWFFLPEVDDEVLVAFEHGDINRPIVIGALWNGKDKPPDTSGKSDKRTLVSKTGSRIELDDEKNTITIKDGGGKGEIVFKADDKKLTIEAKQGDVVIMAAKGKLMIVAEKGIEMTATANFDVRGQKNANIGSGGASTLKAGGMCAVTGGTTDINAPGAADAAEASTSPAEIPDPLAK
jgi:uncharacterized protein involved in type VI secretion and phage assembly